MPPEQEAPRFANVVEAAHHLWSSPGQSGLLIMAVKDGALHHVTVRLLDPREIEGQPTASAPNVIGSLFRIFAESGWGEVRAVVERFKLKRLFTTFSS